MGVKVFATVTAKIDVRFLRQIEPLVGQCRTMFDSLLRGTGVRLSFPDSDSTDRDCWVSGNLDSINAAHSRLSAVYFLSNANEAGQENAVDLSPSVSDRLDSHPQSVGISTAAQLDFDEDITSGSVQQPLDALHSGIQPSIGHRSVSDERRQLSPSELLQETTDQSVCLTNKNAEKPPETVTPLLQRGSTASRSRQRLKNTRRKQTTSFHENVEDLYQPSSTDVCVEQQSKMSTGTESFVSTLDLEGGTRGETRLRRKLPYRGKQGKGGNLWSISSILTQPLGGQRASPSKRPAPCNSKTAKRGSTSRFLGIGTQGKPYCKSCKKNYSTLGNLLRHIKVHHEGKRFPCSACDATFSCQEALRIHVGVKHQKLRCSCCRLVFADASAKSVHKCAGEESATKRCEYCAKIFVGRSLSNLNKHIRSVHLHQRFSCEVCDQEFSGRDTLRAHMWNVHGHFNCSKCDVTFSSFSELHEHMWLMHNQKLQRSVKNKTGTTNRRKVSKEPKRCPQCDKVFTSNSNMLKHVRVMHHEARWQCPVCERAVKSSEQLERHVKRFHDITSYKKKAKRQQVVRANLQRKRRAQYRCSLVGKESTE